MSPCRAGLLDFRFGGRWRRRAYQREALDVLRTMGRSVHACRALEARAIRDAALAPVVVCPAVRTVSVPRQGTGTMFFVSLARLHVCL